MTSEPDNPSRASDSQLTVLSGDEEITRAPQPPPEPPGGRADAQLRARVVELEARLADLTRCLEDAERRAAELLATHARAEALRREHIALGEAHAGLTRDHALLKQQLGVSLQSEHALQYDAQKLQAVISSRSWRMTAPLRAVMRDLRGLLGR